MPQQVVFNITGSRAGSLTMSALGKEAVLAMQEEHVEAEEKRKAISELGATLL